MLRWLVDASDDERRVPHIPERPRIEAVPSSSGPAYIVTLRGRRIALTPREFAVLDVLLRAGGRTVSVEEILWQAWRERETATCGKVRIAIARLRRRLGDPHLIETIGGEGYRLAKAD